MKCIWEFRDTSQIFRGTSRKSEKHELIRAFSWSNPCKISKFPLQFISFLTVYCIVYTVHCLPIEPIFSVRYWNLRFYRTGMFGTKKKIWSSENQTQELQNKFLHLRNYFFRIQLRIASTLALYCYFCKHKKILIKIGNQNTLYYGRLYNNK